MLRLIKGAFGAFCYLGNCYFKSKFLGRCCYVISAPFLQHHSLFAHEASLGAKQQDEDPLVEVNARYFPRYRTGFNL